MPQSYLSRTSDSQHPQYAHSPSLASPAYAMYQRPPMPMHPLAHSSSASPSGVQMEVGSSSTGRMVDPRYEEEESSPGSANHYTPPRDFEGGPSGRGGKRKGAALDGKDDEQGAVAKRKKKAVSCQSCRKRKLKCDRGWPCGACRDRNEAHLCQWEGGTKPQAAGRDQENPPLLARMDRIESMLGAIAEHVGMKQDSTSTKREAAASRSTASSNRTDQISTAASERNAEGSTSVPNRSLLATGWQPTSTDEARSELQQILNILPDTETVRQMCRYFFDEVDHMHYIVTEEFWQRGLREHEELRMMSQSGGSISRSRLGSDDNLRNHLQFLSLLLSICGLCLLFGGQDFGEVTRHKGVPSAYGIFLDSAQRAFNASNPFEEPTLMSVRFLILQFWAISVIRGLGPGMGLLAQAIHQMYALELDQEPSENMSMMERTDRIRLFHCLAVIDWFSAGSAKRSYTIREEPNRHPFLFGSKTLRERLEANDPIINHHQWIKLELARLNRRAVERFAMSETDAYNATIDIQQELDALYTNLPSHYDLDLTTEIKNVDAAFLERLGLPLSISTQLISLHKRYYIQGWLDPAYRTSRDICFASARRVCSIFRKVFSPYLPMDKLMTTDIGELQASLENRQNIISRLWYVSHHSVGACLLLQHHYALMEVYPTVAGPNTEQVRAEIDEDIRINKRLLLALSVHSKIAKSGLALLTKPETTKQVQEEADHMTRKGARSSLGSAEDEETRKRRAKLAMDLQSITDIDTFGPAAKNQRQGNVYEPRSASQPDFKGGYLALSGPTSSMQANNNNPLGTINATTTTISRDEMAEMEALLQSTFSTDLYTGLPLAPETSFQRQADRSGQEGSQPYLSSEVFGGSPAYTAAFLANLDSGMNQSGFNAHQHSSMSNHLNQPVHVAAKQPGSNSWF